MSKDDKEGLVEVMADALGTTGNDADPGASEEGDDGEDEDEEDEKPRRRGKAKEVEVTLEHAVHDAFSDLEQLGEECREVVDNTPEGLNQTQRIQTLEATADESETSQGPEVSAELAELPVWKFTRSSAVAERPVLGRNRNHAGMCRRAGDHPRRR